MALWRTTLRSRGISGSRLVVLIVGGMTPSLIALMQMMASAAPAAPSMWPTADLVALMWRRVGLSPNTFLTAFISLTSPIGVDVACEIGRASCREREGVPCVG